MTKRVAAFCAALLSSFAVFLIVALWGATFQMDGNVSRALLPGATAPINVRISNPHFYPITVSDLTVRIDKITPAHKGETCSASNFTLRQPAKFIVRLPAFGSATMDTISPSKADWPSLKLIDDGAKLDNGCQGASVTLAYSAAGTWWAK